MKWAWVAAFLLSSLPLPAQEAAGNTQEPPVLGPHWERGLSELSKPASGSPDMSYHAGPILPSVTIKAIFWGPGWSSPADKITGLDKWYKYVGTTSGGNGSKYDATVNEYNDTSGHNVTTATTYQGHVIDTSALPARLSPTAVLAEVCKEIPKPVTNGYYPVYVSSKRGNAGYCAYHSAASCHGTSIEFGFFFNLDGDPGCDPGSTVGGESQGLQALANVTGHELSETRSDPRGNAWFDSSGNENGDKCAWTFGGPYVTFMDGTHWKIQGNWSNYAFDHNTGYRNSSGEKGCVDGTNYPGPYIR
ncbi:MAG: hypothetical protein JOZ14_10475 [Acidobacteria bacterium]|nr:hypothetical protein [Acidobacteriota bacterium]